MSFVSDFMSAVNQVKDDLKLGDGGPQVFTWNGADYQCLASRDTKAAKLEFGGFGLEQTLTIIVDVTLFGDGARPVKENTLTYRSITYRIDSVLTGPNGSFLKLTCVSPARGA